MVFKEPLYDGSLYKIFTKQGIPFNDSAVIHKIQFKKANGLVNSVFGNNNFLLNLD